jgi:hypothetical protein
MMYDYQIIGFKCILFGLNAVFDCILQSSGWCCRATRKVTQLGTANYLFCIHSWFVTFSMFISPMTSHHSPYHTDAMGRVVDGWDKQNRRYTEPWDNVKTINGDDLTNSDDTSEEDELGLYSDAMTAPEYEEEDDETASITLQSTSTDDVCEFNEETNKWTSSNSLDECPVEPNISFMDALKSRANWLVGLLALQSCSGFILARNEALLQDHPVIVYFLTMLVGAGGNAGNQASVRGE